MADLVEYIGRVKSEGKLMGKKEGASCSLESPNHIPNLYHQKTQFSCIGKKQDTMSTSLAIA